MYVQMQMHAFFHWAADNKRLDEWVSEDRIDFDNAQGPKVEEKKPRALQHDAISLY